MPDRSPLPASTRPDDGSTAYTRTRPRDRATNGTSTYSALLKQVKADGLLRRRTGYYWTVFAVLIVTLGLAGATFALLGESWFQLIVAGVLGVLFTQFAFLSHEAAHRQIFASHTWNDRAARYGGTFLAGVSYAWWMNKHTRHHGNPNTVGKGPDISFDAIFFRPEDAAAKRGPMRVLVRMQGYAFFPMFLLEGANLHWQSIKTYLTGTGIKGRWSEGSVFLARFVLYIGVLLWFLPLGMAFAFLGVQLTVFGVYMGIAFAPNHKGMPIIEEGQKVDFFTRQVLTSRNIHGGRWMEHFMGGLNYQVEHHLFPNMARPNLRAARLVVQQFCAENDVPYTETSLIRSYAIVVQYLNHVGLAARDPFACPMMQQYRTRNERETMAESAQQNETVAPAALAQQSRSCTHMRPNRCPLPRSRRSQTLPRTFCSSSSARTSESHRCSTSANSDSRTFAQAPRLGPRITLTRDRSPMGIRSSRPVYRRLHGVLRRATGVDTPSPHTNSDLQHHPGLAGHRTSHPTPMYAALRTHSSTPADTGGSGLRNCSGQNGNTSGERLAATRRVGIEFTPLPARSHGQRSATGQARRGLEGGFALTPPVAVDSPVTASMVGREAQY